MENVVLKIENLSHRYSVQWAIKDINFEIPGKGGEVNDYEHHVRGVETDGRKCLD